MSLTCVLFLNDACLRQMRLASPHDVRLAAHGSSPQHIKHDRQSVADASGEGQQVKDRMKIRNALAQAKEDHTDGIKQPAAQHQRKALLS